MPIIIHTHQHKRFLRLPLAVAVNIVADDHVVLLPPEMEPEHSTSPNTTTADATNISLPPETAAERLTPETMGEAGPL